MLVLARKVGERIVIGEDVVVHVVSVKGQTVRLAVEAPGQIVDREEVAERRARGDGAGHKAA